VIIHREDIGEGGVYTLVAPAKGALKSPKNLPKSVFYLGIKLLI